MGFLMMMAGVCAVVGCVLYMDTPTHTTPLFVLACFFALLARIYQED